MTLLEQLRKELGGAVAAGDQVRVNRLRGQIEKLAGRAAGRETRIPGGPMTEPAPEPTTRYEIVFEASGTVGVGTATPEHEENES